MDALREHVTKLLDWRDAHIGFEETVEAIPPEQRASKPGGSPHSPWQLLEHMRLAQQDILEFCVNPDYAERNWPDDYWPESEGPPDEKAWNESVRQFVNDRAAMIELVNDAETDLFAGIPHGSGQTYLREALLVADHNAYHLGQLVLLRRMLEP